jgi:tetratricopeptide (TPR) repeat protein
LDKIKKATKEYLASLTARPDQWSSHYNLGNYYLNRGDIKQALASYDIALRLEPRAAMVMVNAAMAYAQIGEKERAEKSLLQAIKIAPDNAAAHFNLGLLWAELNRGKEAERELKEAFRLDPKMAQAAYNLCILTVKSRPQEALSWCRKAVELNPQEPRYGYTLAFYQKEQGDLKAAATTLHDLLVQRPAFTDAYLLLAEICAQQGDRLQAKKVLDKGLQEGTSSPQDQDRVKAMLQKLAKP